VDKRLALTNKLEKLSIQLANEKEGQLNPTNQCPNTWRGNCKGYGHLAT
jgi:hypothetical protein